MPAPDYKMVNTNTYDQPLRLREVIGHISTLHPHPSSVTVNQLKGPITTRLPTRLDGYRTRETFRLVSKGILRV